MIELSFSERTKETLSQIVPKKGCCRRAYFDAMSLKEMSDESREASMKNEKFICSSCFSHYLRGLFILYGNITSPEKQYHMEFALPSAADAQAVSEFLYLQGFLPKTTKRKNKFIVYFKNSGEIEDILCKMGANSAAFELMNSKIVREIRNNTNRQVNCDSANINKTLNASKKHLEAIRLINEAGLYNELPEDLKEAADLRLAFPEATLSQLGVNFSHPISKSGVSHRLERIVDFAKSKNLL